MSRDEVDQGLPLFAGYQRFYGVLEPDDEQNRLFFARFAEPSRDGLLLGAWDDRALVGFACLYWTFSSVMAARIALLSDLFVTERARGRRPTTKSHSVFTTRPGLGDRSGSGTRSASVAIGVVDALDFWVG